MRVTANTFPNSLVDQLNQLALRQNRLQNQAATGQRVQLPEDDPAAMRRVLSLQSESKALDQYQSNITSLQDRATASYAVVKGLQTISDRVGEITVQADQTKSRQQLQIYGKEISQLIQQAVQLSNSKDRGEYLFGGTKS